jgi:hypothetical protein
VQRGWNDIGGLLVDMYSGAGHKRLYYLLIYHFPSFVAQYSVNKLYFNVLMEQMGLLFDESRQRIDKLRLCDKDYQLLIIAFAVTVGLVFRLDEILHLIQAYTQTEDFQKALQTSHNEIATVGITMRQVAGMHYTMVFVSFE